MFESLNFFGNLVEIMEELFPMNMSGFHLDEETILLDGSNNFQLFHFEKEANFDLNGSNDVQSYKNKLYAPEFFDNGTYDLKSQVWDLGVLLH